MMAKNLFKMAMEHMPALRAAGVEEFEIKADGGVLFKLGEDPELVRLSAPLVRVSASGAPSAQVTLPFSAPSETLTGDEPAQPADNGDQPNPPGSKSQKQVVGDDLDLAHQG